MYRRVDLLSALDLLFSIRDMGYEVSDQVILELQQELGVHSGVVAA